MFHKLMRFGFGGFALAAALVYMSSASTIAGYQPAFERAITVSDGGTVLGFDLAAFAIKAVHEQEARAILNEGAGLGNTTLNRATKSQSSIASVRPTSVSGWRSGRVRTLAG